MHLTEVQREAKRQVKKSKGRLIAKRTDLDAYSAKSISDIREALKLTGNFR